MYEIFAYPYGDPENKLTVYQPGNRQAVVLSPKLTREVSKGGSLTFTMLRTHPCYESMQKMSTAVAVHQDGKEIWRGRVLSHEADWLNRRVIYCEGALSYFNDSYFWVVNRTLGVSEAKDQLQVWSVTSTIAWAIGVVEVLVLSFFM